MPERVEIDDHPKSEKRLSQLKRRFRAKRKSQLDRWQKAHPGSGRKAAQHLHGPE